MEKDRRLAVETEWAKGVARQRRYFNCLLEIFSNFFMIDSGLPGESGPGCDPTTGTAITDRSRHVAEQRISERCQMPTQDQVVQAGICVYDYVLNPAVRGEFNRVLAAAKATPNDADKIVQNFFDRRQYATTPDAFKQVSSDYAKNPLTLSPKATRFAIDFAANSVLRLDWYDAARQMAAAQSATNSATAPSGAQPDPLAPLNDVLQRNGYTGVTADQATLAQTRLLTSGIGAWTGIYSKTTIFNETVDRKDGPSLTIDTSENPIQVRLNKKHILDYTFDSDTNTLSWEKTGGGDLSPNNIAATLYFSRDDAPSFTGTLDNADGKFSYFGSADQSGTSAGGGSGNGSGGSGDGGKLSSSDWIAIASGIVGFAALVATAVGVHIARKAWGVAEKSPTERAMLDEINRLVTTLQDLERSSQITPDAFANLVSQARVKEAIQTAVALGQIQAEDIRAIDNLNRQLNAENQRINDEQNTQNETDREGLVGVLEEI
jgi:hypothetical protein